MTEFFSQTWLDYMYVLEVLKGNAPCAAYRVHYIYYRVHGFTCCKFWLRYNSWPRG